MKLLRPWLVATLVAASSAAAEEVTFRFVPPVGRAFLERELRTTETRVGGNKEKHSTAMLARVQVAREGGVVYVSHRIDEIAAAKEGEKFETLPQIAVLKGSRLVHVVRPDGTLSRVDGYGEIAAKAMPHMNPEAKKALEKMIAEGRQDAQDRAQWYEAEMLIGQTLELDRDYWYESAWSDEAGWTKHQTLLRLGPWVDHPHGGRLLTVDLAYVPSALALVPGATRLESKIASRFRPSDVKPVGLGQRVEGRTSWWLDPATMTTWRLQTFRKVSQAVQVSQELGVTVVSEVRAEKNLEPAAAPAKK
jgi:hypothetical protein